MTKEEEESEGLITRSRINTGILPKIDAESESR